MTGLMNLNESWNSLSLGDVKGPVKKHKSMYGHPAYLLDVALGGGVR